MKYSVENYAQAFLDSLAVAKDIEACVSGFVRTIAKHGDISRADRIIDEVQRKYVSRQGGRNISIEFARSQSEDEVAKLKDCFDEKDTVKVVINPSLVAGVRVTIDGHKEIDKTMSRKISNLFK